MLLMGKLVTPEVYLVGYSGIDRPGLEAYLKATDNLAFLEDLGKAVRRGLSDGEILTSFYAKLCYNSLTPGKNDNLTGVRDIEGNLIGTMEQAHGSVWEHCNLNFAVHNASRVCEIELCRHRAGTAFSILSGRYFRSNNIDLVFDPILDPLKDLITEGIQRREQEYTLLCDAMGMNGEDGVRNALTRMFVFESPPTESDVNSWVNRIGGLAKTRDQKKVRTSALRRLMPEGRAKEIGFSVNLRAVKHIVMMRTSRHSEWEIREVFGQVYRILKDKFPLLFYGAKEMTVDGQLEVSGLRLQPYEQAQ
jgi:thymidylate synthase (FAD)